MGSIENGKCSKEYQFSWQYSSYDKDSNKIRQQTHSAFNLRSYLLDHNMHQLYTPLCSWQFGMIKLSTYHLSLRCYNGH